MQMIYDIPVLFGKCRSHPNFIHTSHVTTNNPFLMASSIVPLHFFQFKMRFDCWHGHQHHVMSMALSIALLYLLGQDNWRNVQHNLFGHVMTLMLVSVSHDANSIINETILFFCLRWWKGDATWYFGYVMHWHQHQHQHHVLSTASSMAPFYLFSKIIKMRCNVLSGYCNAIHTGVNVTCC